jgi:PAS domain S-box-containing protein
MAELLRKMTTAIPVAAVLADVAALIEASGDGLLCGVMLADPRGELLRLGAAPSLPADYAAGLDGLPIAEGRGCCGTAAARRALVTVADIDSSPLWTDYRQQASEAGLGACWSIPFFDADDGVAGTLAVYTRAPREPTAEEVATLHCAALLTGLVVMRHRDAERLRTSVDNYRELAELAPDAVYVHDDGRLLYANAAGWKLLGFESTPADREFSFDVVLPSEAANALKRFDGDAAALSWRREDGTIAEIEVRAAPVRLDGLEARLVVCRDWSERRRLEREVLTAAEGERARIAADLHDGIGQQLVGVNLYLGSAIARMAACDAELKDQLKQIVEMVSELTRQVRLVASASFPIEVERDGLATALAALARRADMPGAVRVRFAGEAGADAGLDRDVATQIYRIGQEAVSNALRHANPTRVELALMRDASVLVFRVSNDGKEFRSAGENSGLGRRSMSYRAALIGAHLTIGSGATGGALVEVRVDIAGSAKPAVDA